MLQKLCFWNSSNTVQFGDRNGSIKMSNPIRSQHSILSLAYVTLFLVIFFDPSTINLSYSDEKMEFAKNIVATKIRAQGYKCDSPKSAKRDEKLSKPDEPVWVLECKTKTYRVRLIPDQAAKVEQIK